MTRFLSESLQAEESSFRLGLRKLESANGNPNADIRFSSEVIQATNHKLRQLGLDPDDTTTEELYHALQQRIKADDQALTRRLRTSSATHISAEGDVVAGMIHELKQLPDSRRCFALKPNSFKQLIKDLPPKKAMKQLGYRSLDSFLKHEQPASIIAAAWMSEGSTWRHKLMDHYKKLSPSDFENRSISLIHLESPKWKQLTSKVVAEKRHNLLCFKELGALVFLPLPKNVPGGVVTASLSLALHELNQIRSASTFLKLCQVRPDFGDIVRRVATEEPELRSIELDQPVSWHLIQQYYVRLADRFKDELFEPQIRLEDMAWHAVESSLAKIEPSLAFWEGSHYLGLVRDKQTVSLNIVDSALNYCNSLAFDDRMNDYFRKSLGHELLLRYLRHDTVEQTVTRELQPQLAVA